MAFFAFEVVFAHLDFLHNTQYLHWKDSIN